MSKEIEKYVAASEMHVDTEEFEAVADTAAQLVVTSEAEYADYGKFLIEVKQRAKDLKAERDKVLKPLKSAVKELEAWFRPALTALDRAEMGFKKAMLTFRAEQEEKQRALVAAAQHQAKTGNHTAAKALVGQMNVNGPAAAGVSSRKTWKARVIDEALVPREYLVVNQAKLDQFAKLTKGAGDVPGVEFYEQETLAART
jgi:hypothetical protein